MKPFRLDQMGNDYGTLRKWHGKYFCTISKIGKDVFWTYKIRLAENETPIAASTGYTGPSCALPHLLWQLRKLERDARKAAV